MTIVIASGLYRLAVSLLPFMISRRRVVGIQTFMNVILPPTQSALRCLVLARCASTARPIIPDSAGAKAQARAALIARRAERAVPGAKGKLTSPDPSC